MITLGSGLFTPGNTSTGVTPDTLAAVTEDRGVCNSNNLPAKLCPQVHALFEVLPETRANNACTSFLESGLTPMTILTRSEDKARP